MKKQQQQQQQQQQLRRSLTKIEEHGAIILKVLRKRINVHTTMYTQILSEVTAECDKLKKEIDTIYAKMQQQLKRAYNIENKRLTDMQDELDNELMNRRMPDSDLNALIQQTKNNLKTKVSYEFKHPDPTSSTTATINSTSSSNTPTTSISSILSEYSVKVHMSVTPNMWVPTDVQAVILPSGDVKVTWTLEETQQKALLTGKMNEIIHFRVDTRASGSKTSTSTIVEHGCSCILPSTLFFSDWKYYIRVRMEHKKVSSDWSPQVTIKTPEFSSLCAWKQCPETVDPSRQYAISSSMNGEIATKIGDYCHSTVIGKISFPRNCVTSYVVRVVNSKDDNGASMWLGVAPYNIDQDAGNANVEHCGWYISCYGGYLTSGPPHCFNHKGYADTVPGGSKFKEGGFVKNKSKIKILFDSVKGTLEFWRKGKSLGIAFDGIPLDVPIVPVVLFYYKDDSVELSLT